MVKAHQVISGHRSDPSRLPGPLRTLPFASDARGHIVRPSRELRDAAIDTLLEALGPMGDKLEAILLQLPPLVAYGDAQLAEVGQNHPSLRTGPRGGGVPAPVVGDGGGASR